jgi:hypothetical protein
VQTIEKHMQRLLSHTCRWSRARIIYTFSRLSPQQIDEVMGFVDILFPQNTHLLGAQDIILALASLSPQQIGAFAQALKKHEKSLFTLNMEPSDRKHIICALAPLAPEHIDEVMSFVGIFLPSNKEPYDVITVISNLAQLSPQRIKDLAQALKTHQDKLPLEIMPDGTLYIKRYALPYILPVLPERMVEFSEHFNADLSFGLKEMTAYIFSA